MNINRHNYEEFFILYMDNELNAESRREVETFVLQNPDLKGELDILMQSKLTPDTEISFADKGSLLRFDSLSISPANYEEWLTSYIDNELTEDERKSVEEFVAHHPAAQKELNLLQRTKLEPEEIVFPHKESLYRRTEKARVISIRWMRIAVAAVLLLAFGTTTVVLLNNNDRNNSNTNGPVIAQTNPEKAKVNNNTQQVNGTQTNESTAVTTDKKKNESNELAETRGSNLATSNQINNERQKKEREETVIPEKSFANSDNRKEDKTATDPGHPIDNSPVTGNKVEPIGAIAGTNGDDPLTDSQQKLGSNTVTPPKVDSYNNGTGAETIGEERESRQFASNDNNGNKGLRGFFRKVTRTIEKRTNIKATDDDDRLLIAGLAIKMN